MSDTDRLAAALHKTGHSPARAGEPMCKWCPQDASVIIAADPTLVCPDPDAHVRLCTFRPPWAEPCGKPQDDPIHPGPDERKMPGQHVYRSEGISAACRVPDDDATTRIE